MNAAIKLHSFVPIDRGARVRWTAAELGLSVQECPLNPQAGEHKSDAYRKLNPFGLVPAVEGEGCSRFESMAICLSLAENTAGQTLVPMPGSALRNEFLTWLFFGASTLDNVIERLLVAKRFNPDATAFAQATDRYSALLAVLEQHMTGRAYLIGEQFSLADIVLGHAFAIARLVGLHDLAGPALSAYRERLAARPAAEQAGLFAFSF